MNVQGRLFKKKKEKKERKKKKMQNKPQRESKENSIAAIANIVLAATLCEDIRNDFLGGLWQRSLYRHITLQVTG